jgi:hypothetical protein
METMLISSLACFLRETPGDICTAHLNRGDGDGLERLLE